MAENARSDRVGILCAGNWVVDHVKLISTWPGQETLADIVGVEHGTGGSAYNVSTDLARFDLGIPIQGLGLVGDDADGESILEHCDRWKIGRNWVRKSTEAGTAYTDVMSVVGTGRRTFFHYRGANALLSVDDFPFDEITSRVACLAYLMLLDTLDKPDPEFGTGAARVLASLRERGVVTVIDVVSANSDEFARVVPPSLPHTDHCILNEIEAGCVTGRELRVGDALVEAEVQAAARELMDRGVQQRVVVHAPEGAFAVDRDLGECWQPSFQISPENIKGSVGAGDAFMAGMLVGIHEGWELERSLRFANAAALTCLSHPTTTGGVATAAEIDKLARGTPLRR